MQITLDLNARQLTALRAALAATELTPSTKRKARPMTEHRREYMAEPRVSQPARLPHVRCVERLTILFAAYLRAQKPRLAALIHVRLGHAVCPLGARRSRFSR
jgi:hypothetical protein